MHDPKDASAEAQALADDFAKMPLDQQRLALAKLFGVDPAKAVFVRAPDGSIRLQEVSAEARDRIRQLGEQGFQTASFSNRRARRAEKALARRSKPRRSASAG